MNDTAPLLVDAAGAARLCSVSRAKWFQLYSAGRVPAPIRTLGERLPRWNFEELRAWAAAGAPPRDVWNKLKAAQQ